MKSVKILLTILLLVMWRVSAAERVASLSPTVTQLILLLGGQESLCGRSSACYFAPVSDVPVVGDMGRPFPEAVLASRAALVITDALHPEANWAVLRRCGVRVETLPVDNIGELPENLRKIGSWIGRTAAAENMAAALEAKILALRQNPPAKRIRAAVLFGTAPLITCGRNSFITDVLALAGVDNAAQYAGQGYFILNPEYLYLHSPDVILIIGVPPETAQRDLTGGLLRHLPAVKQQKIIHLDPQLWSRLTPEIIDAAAALQNSELFND